MDLDILIIVMIIDCINIANIVKNNVKNFVITHNINLKLAIISVEPDNASKIYLKNKIKSCRYCGILVEIFYYYNTSTKEIINKIIDLNKDKNITCILVQLPLPNYINEEEILNSIDPNKDVDCLTHINLGKLFFQKNINDNILTPCTANGCIKIIKSVYSDISGKKAVVIGRSNIVGKPLAQLLLQENCTVSILHSKSKNIEEETKKADIIAVAVGRAKFLKINMIKKQSFIIDIGINRLEDNNICGDVDFEEIKDFCEFITPVPKGVGQLTVACLMENILKCHKIQVENEYKEYNSGNRKAYN